MASPTVAPDPVTTLTASAGKPASSMISTSFTPDRGVSLAGLRTTAFPAARAGPTLWQTRFRGKLKGVIAATTPQGTRRVKPNFPAPLDAALRSSVSPVRRLASSADRVIVSWARDASPIPSERILPSSRVIVRPSSCRRPVIRSAARCSSS